MKLSPLSNQVGGHDGVLSMGDENEIIVKPALAEELRFYEEAVLHPELQTWMPAYYGTLTLTRQQPQMQQQQQQQKIGQNSSGNLAEALASSQHHQAGVSVVGGTTTTTTTSAPTITAINGYAFSQLLPLDQLRTLDSGKEKGANGGNVGINNGTGAVSTTTTTTKDKDKVKDTNENEADDAECVCLENLSHGFYRPCVLDLKLGTQLWDDKASEEKKKRLTKVASETTSGSLGFRLTGFQVFDNDKNDFIKYLKDFGKKLKDDNVVDGFRSFFSAKLGPQRMRLVLERFINDLADILATMEDQEVRMRSSSLLFIYEGDPEAFDEGLMMEQEKIANVVARSSNNNTKSKAAGSALNKKSTGFSDHRDADTEDSELSDDDDEEDDLDDDDDELRRKVTDLRLIDFAHSTWTPGQGPDSGVLLGLRSTLSLFEKLVETDYPADA